MTAPNPTNLATLAMLKAELKFTDVNATRDAVLQTYLDIASDLIRKACNRTFEYASNFTEHVAGYATPVLQVRTHLPMDVTAGITSITYDLLGAPGSPVDPTAYAIQKPEVGLIYNRYGWYWTAPLLSNVRMSPYTGYERHAYTVVYSGGYVTQQQVDNGLFAGPATLPPELAQAAILAAVSLYRWQGQNPNIQSESLMSYAVTYKKNSLFGSLLTNGADGGGSLVDLVIRKYRFVAMSY